MQIYRGFQPPSSPEILGGTLGKVHLGMWAKPKEYACGFEQGMRFLEDFSSPHLQRS